MPRITRKEIRKLKYALRKKCGYTWDDAEEFRKVVGYLPQNSGVIKLEVGNLVSFTGRWKEGDKHNEYNYETTLFVLSNLTWKSWKVLDQIAEQTKVLRHKERWVDGEGICWVDGEAICWWELEGAAETYRQELLEDVLLLSR